MYFFLIPAYKWYACGINPEDNEAEWDIAYGFDRRQAEQYARIHFRWTEVHAYMTLHAAVTQCTKLQNMIDKQWIA